MDFKPITEGLGFHKKPIQLKSDSDMEVHAQVKNPWALPQKKSQVSGNLEVKTQKAFAPTPQPNTKNNPSTQRAPTQKTQPQPHAWTPQISDAAFEEAAPLRDASVSWSSIFMDTLMVVGLSLLFLAGIFSVTEISLTTVFDSASSEIGAQLALSFLLFGVFQVYSVGTRVFFGKTLGEWASGCRLGTLEQQERFLYPFQLAIRCTVIALTGFISIPILSTLLGEDVGRAVSGIELKSESI